MDLLIITCLLLTLTGCEKSNETMHIDDVTVREILPDGSLGLNILDDYCDESWLQHPTI